MTSRLTGARPGLWSLILPIVLLAAAVALWRWQSAELDSAETRRDDGRDAVNAATLETMTWASVDYRKPDEYFAAVQKGATGVFLQQFKASVPATRQLLKQNRSVQVPTIPKDGAGLLELKGDTARVLIAMDATVTNKSTDKPQPRQYRLQVTLTRSDGRWLTSGLEFINAQS